MILCPPRSNRTDKLFPYPRLCRATRVLRHIILPHCVPGAVAGSIMVFMLAVGTYVVPAMLGGKGAIWFVQLIYSRFYDALNWNRSEEHTSELQSLMRLSSADFCLKQKPPISQHIHEGVHRHA